MANGKRVICAAKTKSGGICKLDAVIGMTRCRFHGGLSTGAKTVEGKARSLAAMLEGKRKWVEKMKASGIKFPGGCKTGELWHAGTRGKVLHVDSLNKEVANIIACDELLTKLKKETKNGCSFHA